MLELEVIVMIIGLRAESYLLHHHFSGFGLLLLLLLFLLIEIFLVVEHPAYRGIGHSADFYQVKLHVACYAQGFGQRVYAGFHVVAYEAHFTGTNCIVDGVLILGLLSGALPLSGFGA